MKRFYKTLVIEEDLVYIRTIRWFKQNHWKRPWRKLILRKFITTRDRFDEHQEQLGREVSYDYPYVMILIFGFFKGLAVLDRMV